ncbi:hypothetical protein AAFF_G00436680 [Aldrovandia affinis]|uniref:Uncharacterized protein n=1 Tax=Aldrovandia affinis TaxID=143900 RepID=A0AAD7S835_9TELE|nr:hypothetical protein AAFF_G00436680 [Aldrovandia affinis]
MHTEEGVEVRREQAESQRCNACALLEPSEETGQPFKSHGRRYLPHGHGEEVAYRPQMKHIEPKLTESLRSVSERTLELTLGRKKQVKSFCSVTPGSKAYISPEYSMDFYKLGSTLPTVGFGSSATLKGDTFIPLQRPTIPRRVTYQQNKEIKAQEADILKVRELDDWRPAMPISPPLFDNRHGKYKKPDTLRRTLQGGPRMPAAA